jgi:hypothetical protein
MTDAFELMVMIRVAPGGLFFAAALILGSRVSTKRKCARWFAPKWLSIPSTVTSRWGFAEPNPAFAMVISSSLMEASSRISCADCLVAARESRSNLSERNLVPG